jgi:PKD repeat protein
VSGQGTNTYSADWNTVGAATVNLTASNACGSTTRTLAVNVSGCVRLAGEATAPIAAPTVNVYPNPATELITITYGATQTETVQLQLKDVSGRVVMTASLNAQEGENQSQMDVSTLAKGMYMLEVNAATAKQQVRVVVQ